MTQLGKVFRANLRRHLIDCGWTQGDLAAEMEVSQPYVSQLLNGPGDPSFSTVERIAEIFDIPPEELLREKNPV